MNFLSQLLPGFRVVRAPLISGYLWLMVAWLLFRDDLPKSGESEVYGRAADLAEAIGPVALAVAASVAAYLIGSLIKAALVRLGDSLVVLKRNHFKRGWTAAPKEIILLGAVGKAPLFSPANIDWFDGDEKAKSRLKSLVDAELGPSVDKLEESIATTTKKVATDQKIRGRREDPSLELALQSEAKVESEPTVSGFVVLRSKGRLVHKLSEQPGLPIFSADRDIFEERAAIKTLLMETTQQAGSEVERLYSEAELRFYVALPLAALLILLWAESGDWAWIFLLAAPIGLLLHAIVLNKQGGLEMVEALRSRNSPDDLQRITPVFSRYKLRAAELSEAIEEFDWLGMVRRLDADISAARTPARSGSAES